MKKQLIFGVLASSLMFVTACNKNNGCPNNSERAKMRDFTDSTGCGWLVQLEDGTKLQPTNLSEFSYVPQEEGQLVWVKYKEAAGASQCDEDQTVVELKCLSEREF